jgi:hypothetical protein
MVIYVFYVSNLLYNAFINEVNFAIRKTYVIYAPRITISMKALIPDTVTNECPLYDG